jgi:hypothetical protein
VSAGWSKKHFHWETNNCWYLSNRRSRLLTSSFLKFWQAGNLILPCSVPVAAFSAKT